MSDSLQPHGLQHARPPYPSLCPRVCSDSCPLSQWCHPAISSSVTPFSSCPQSFLASGSFLADNELALCIRWPKYWSFSFSISPYNEYSGLISFRIDWFDLHAVQGTLKSLSQHHNSKVSILQCSALFPESSHPSAVTLTSPSHRTSLPQSQVGLMTPCFLLGACIPSPLSNVVTNWIMFMFSCLFLLRKELGRENNIFLNEILK